MAEPNGIRPVLWFAGQGAQRVGMGRELCEASPAARALFDRAGEILGIPLSATCFHGPEEILTRTDVCQPALYTAALAGLAALRERLGGELPPVTACAGLSLGEFSALAAAGVVSFEDGLELVRLRGRLMQQACDETPGGMLAVIGLSPDRAQAVARACGLDLANCNAPGQTVLSGARDRIETAAEAALAAGAKRAIPLQVAGAYHSRLMASAAGGLREALAGTAMQVARFPVVCNVTGRPESSPERLRELLVRQLVSTVRWEDCMRSCLDQGGNLFLEFGPGGVLSGLLRRVDRSAPVHTIESPLQVEAAAAGLAERPGGGA